LHNNDLGTYSSQHNRIIGIGNRGIHGILTPSPIREPDVHNQQIASPPNETAEGTNHDIIIVSIDVVTQVIGKRGGTPSSGPAIFLCPILSRFPGSMFPDTSWCGVGMWRKDGGNMAVDNNMLV